MPLFRLSHFGLKVIQPLAQFVSHRRPNRQRIFVLQQEKCDAATNAHKNHNLMQQEKCDAATNAHKSTI